MTSDEECLRLSDFEERARKILSKYWFKYFSGGANEEITLRENIRAFRRYQIIPRVLRDVSKVNTGTTVLGHPVAFPVCIAPTAMHGHAHSDAELGTARGASSMNTIYTQSIWSNLTVDEVSDATGRDGGVRFLQIQFLFVDGLMMRLVALAEKLNYKALVLTADDPIPGKRTSWNKAAQELGTGPSYGFGHFVGHEYPSPENNFLCGPTATWDHVKWLKSQTRLPIIVKGIVNARDAVLAVEAGAAGVLVSNHGGRQLDCMPATIDVLADVVKAVDGRCEVYLDGGVRHGTDVLKALAFGARCVFIGRPVVYALAYKGEEGVRQMLNILKDEFSYAMALSGCASVEEIPSLEIRHCSFISNL